MVQNDLNKRPV